MPLVNILLVFAVTAPGFVFGVLGVLWLLGWQPREHFVARLTSITFFAAVLATVALGLPVMRSDHNSVVVELGNWFSVGTYSFSLALLGDRLSIPLLALTVSLSGLIGSFSRRYLHRESGYFRFFLLLNLFAFGASVAFTAGSLDLLITGWELVGITSVLLIAFFQQRRQPVQNAMRVFAMYRIGDLGLLLGVFLLHHLTGTASCRLLFRGDWPIQGTTLGESSATVVGLLFLLAAAAKSAQVPFSGWLPRAMEGPTPSSAIFYGAISVHLGIYLLLRSEAMVLASPIVLGAVIAVGLITAVHATLSARASSDAKTSLAYAALAQLGLIFVEIGLGWTWLALMHVVGHAAVRTLQFLRAPSMLHDYHRVYAASGGNLGRTGTHYEALLPTGLRGWLYRLALDRGHLDNIVDRLVAAPLVRAAQKMLGEERPSYVPAESNKAPSNTESLTPTMAGSYDA
jgi:NADH:ubiquinone oxidoreductase subunit 5 (subunit L)/multisubunit Na+/H+ antiporter MnhA subunit